MPIPHADAVLITTACFSLYSPSLPDTSVKRRVLINQNARCSGGRSSVKRQGQSTTNDVACQSASRLANPVRKAYNAAWVRLARCNLLKMFPTWVRTVRSLIPNTSAIS